MATADLRSQPLHPAAAPDDRSVQEAGSLLQRNLTRLAARRNWRHMLQTLAQSLTWGIGIAALMLLAYRFYLVDGRPWMLAVPIVLSLGIGYYLGRLRCGGSFAAALEADQTLELKDELSSALAFVRPDAVQRVRSQQPATGSTRVARWRATTANALRPRPVLHGAPAGTATELVPALVQDAATRSNNLDPRQLYPVKFDRTWIQLALVTVFFIAFAFMPDVPWLLSKEQKATAATLKAEGKKLEEVSKEVLQEKEAPKQEEIKRLNKRMAELGKEMQRGRMTKRAALAEMGELKKELEKAAQNRSNQNSSSSGVEQAMKALQDQQMQTPEGKQFQEEMKKGDLEAAAKQAEKLAERIEEGKMTPEEQKQAANDLQKAADALRRQGGKQGEQLADQMEQAAKALKQQAQQGGQQQQNGQGQQNQSGQQNGQQQNAQGNAQAGKALREMAKGMRSGAGTGNSSQALKDMLKKIQEAENQTGSNNSQQGGSKEGEGKSGEGQCKGGDCKDGLTPGKDITSSNPDGLVGGGAGLGPRNNADGNKGGGPSDQKMKRTGDKRRWGDVWSNRLPATKKEMDRIKGKYGSQGEAEQLQTQTEAEGGPVKTPYYEVYESYKKDAEDAISKEVVPPSYKAPVKEYFDSIDPKE